MLGILCRPCIYCGKRFPVRKRRRVCIDCQEERKREGIKRRDNKPPWKVYA